MGRDGTTGVRNLTSRALGFALILAAATVDVGWAQDPACRAADATVNEGWQRYRLGDVAAAGERFAQARTACPTHLGAAVGSGYVELRNGNLGSAETYFRHALEVDSTVVDAWVGLGVIAWQAGDTAAVRSRFTRVQRLDPGNPEARRYLGRLTRPAVRIDTARLVADLIARARTATAETRYSEASALYDSVLVLSPTRRDARFALAQVLAWGGRYDTAISVYESLLARDVGDVDTRKGLARVTAWSGNLAESERRWQDIVDDRPNDVEAQLGLAQVRRWRGRLDGADSALSAAERLAPDNAAVAQERLALRQARGPTANPFVTFETDSDGNDMTTLLAAAGMRVYPQIFLTGRLVFRSARNTPGGVTDLSSSTISLDASYAPVPRWILRAGVGLNTTSAATPNRVVVRAGVTAPTWNGLTPSLDYRHEPLDVTAPLIANGIHYDELVLSGYGELSGWILQGSYGFALVHGGEHNPRHLLMLEGLRNFVSDLRAGLRGRFLSFGKDVNDGYFDPVAYGLLEVPVQWSRQLGHWLLFAEVNPGLQVIDARVGNRQAAFTFGANGRATYRVAPGRDVGVTTLYSRSGFQTLATPVNGYRYFMIGAFGAWTF